MNSFPHTLGGQGHLRIHSLPLWGAKRHSEFIPSPSGGGPGWGHRVAPPFPHTCPSPQPSPQRGEGARIPSLPLWGRARVGASCSTTVSSRVPLSPALSPKGRGSKNEFPDFLSPPLGEGRGGGIARHHRCLNGSLLESTQARMKSQKHEARTATMKHHVNTLGLPFFMRTLTSAGNDQRRGRGIFQRTEHCLSRLFGLALQPQRARAHG